MKTLGIKVTINRNAQKIKRTEKSFNTDEPLTVEHIKSVIKGELGFPFEVVKEEFWYMSKELQNSDEVPFKSGNEFILTIK